MESVTARNKVIRNMNSAKDGARLIGFNDSGEACVWYGGIDFNVYDAADDWSKITQFISSQLAAISDRTAKEGYGYAKARMRSEGFDVIE